MATDPCLCWDLLLTLEAEFTYVLVCSLCPGTGLLLTLQSYTYWGRPLRPEKIAQGGSLDNRDIVDTKTHASCAAGQHRTKQRAFPIM